MKEASKKKPRKLKASKKYKSKQHADPQNGEILSTLQVRKATTHKGRKFLKSREPQVQEPTKQSLFIRGTQCRMEIKQMLRELNLLRKPYSINLTRPLEGLDLFSNAEPAEYLTRKNDCGLFCYGSSNKNRPYRLILGRIFEGLVLDMYEVLLSDMKSLSLFSKVVQPVMGSKPLVLAQGAEFESSDAMRSFRNCLIDFFSTGRPLKVLVNELDHLIALTSCPIEEPGGSIGRPGVVFHRYRVTQHATKSVSLEECGPSFTMRLDRYKLGDTDTWKSAVKLPKEVKPTKVKNVSTDVLGQTRGRVHVGVQNLTELVTHHHHRGSASGAERVAGFPSGSRPVLPSTKQAN